MLACDVRGGHQRGRLAALLWPQALSTINGMGKRGQDASFPFAACLLTHCQQANAWFLTGLQFPKE